jgi:hypothetical protein
MKSKLTEKGKRWNAFFRAVDKAFDKGEEVRACLGEMTVGFRTSSWRSEGRFSHCQMRKGFTGRIVPKELGQGRHILRFVSDNSGEWINLNTFNLKAVHCPQLGFYYEN